MNKKYIFTDEVSTYTDELTGKLVCLKRIKRLSDGLVGGWIEDESCLSHEGDCFVYDNSMVYKGAKVCDNAKLYGNVIATGNVVISKNAKVRGECVLKGNATITDNANIYGVDIEIKDNAIICGNAIIKDSASIMDNAVITENGGIWHNAVVRDNAKIYDDAKILDRADIGGNSQVFGCAIITGNTHLRGNTIVGSYTTLNRGFIKNIDFTDNIINQIAYTFGVYPNPKTNTYTFYKRVVKKGNIYKSPFSLCDYIFKEGEYTTFHLSSGAEWNSIKKDGIFVSQIGYLPTVANSTIAVEVNLGDIIRCVGHTISCKKVKTIKEISNY